MAEVVISIQVDRDGSLPVYRQIVSEIHNMLRNNKLQSGDRLPSMRDLANQLGVNRNTVALAYAELESKGLVQSRVGSGTFVGRFPGSLEESPPGPASDLAGSLERALSRRGRQGDDLIERISVRDEVSRINLSGSIPDCELFPAGEFGEVLSQVVADMGPAVLDYGSKEGYGPLRSWIASRLRSQGGIIDESELFILNGSQQGLDLASKLLLDDGDCVVIESPTYYNAIGVFRMYGVELIPVGMDGEGIRPDQLKEILSRRRVKLVYCMPTFQNPTGITMSRERRHEILAITARHGVPVLEDHFDAELRYEGQAEAPLKGFPGSDHVLHLGTFSKILFPGLRLGWLALPEVYQEPFRRIRACTDLSAGLLAQVAIHRFCEEGRLDSHLELVKRENKARLAVMLDEMEKQFPDGCTWTRPKGGMSLWVSMPRGVDAVEAWLDARRAGVNFAPGALFHVDGGGSNMFKLSFTREGKDRIAEGIKTLGAILRDRMQESKGVEQSSTNVLL